MGVCVLRTSEKEEVCVLIALTFVVCEFLAIIVEVLVCDSYSE